ncbi:MAG: GyrI-like domain-containing protein [Methylobacteriaceae bacterium]|nr:GyrI-like domain-containing protein [Methylobacteriaceae bacterium]
MGLHQPKRQPIWAGLFAAAVAFTLTTGALTAWAQTSPAPGASTAAPAAPAAPGAAAPAPQAQSPAPSTPAPPAVPPPPSEADKPSGDASSAMALTLEARPVALVKGTSTWDDGYKTITDSFQKINDALTKGGIKPAGRPLAVFTETTDTGFSFQGMVPIEKVEGKPALPADVTLGELPAGKVLKFQHRGAYDEIDSTYEAITAYLDEKGFEAKNLFIEEYLNDVKGSDDTSLAVDIYVYIK